MMSPSQKCTRTAAAVVLLVVAVALLPAASADDLRLDGGVVEGWDESDWYVQVDGVMGGKSSGRLTFEDNVMVFGGDINLNGGGFSSVRRSLPNAIDLSSYAGIVVEVETHAFSPSLDDDDGISSSTRTSPLGLHLQLHDASSYYGFASAFAVPLASEAGRSASVFLPLESFDRGSRMGWTCRDCSLDATSVKEMDVYVLFQEGPFEVRIRSVTAVEEVPPLQLLASPSVPLTSARDVDGLFLSAIRSGGYLYDQKYGELCIAIYWSALSSVVASDKDDGDMIGVDLSAARRVACAGLERSLREGRDDKVSAAWALRHTMDAIVADLSDEERSDAASWLPLAARSSAQDLAVEEGLICSAWTAMPPQRTSVLVEASDQDEQSLVEEVPADSTSVESMSEKEVTGGKDSSTVKPSAQDAPIVSKEKMLDTSASRRASTRSSSTLVTSFSLSLVLVGGATFWL